MYALHLDVPQGASAVAAKSYTFEDVVATLN